MANRKVTIDIVTRANTSGAKQAEAALDGLANSANAATTAAAGTGKAAGKAGQIFQSAGYQVQDFAVQVGGGQSAMIAFAQQAPQFLGAFGPAGAIAGAFIAIGAIATKVFTGMKDDTMSADEKAKALAKTIEMIGEAAEKAVKDNIDFGKQKIEDATTAAKHMAEELNNAAQNQITLNDSIAKSLRTVNEAERELAELRGGTTDKLKIQEEQQKAAATQRQEALNKALAEEQLRLKVAQDALTIAQNELAAKEKQKETDLAALATNSLALEVAKERLKVAKETAKQTTPTPGGLSSGPGSSLGQSFTPTPAATAAQRGLESGSFQNEIDRLKVTVEEMQKSLISTGELTKNVESAARKVTEVEQELRMTFADVDNSVADLTNEAQSEEVKAKVKDQATVAKLLAEEIGVAVKGLEGSTESEKKALEDLKTNLSDKKIDLDEIASTTAALTQLGPLISKALEGNSQKVVQLIQLMNTMVAKDMSLQSQIDNLQRRMTTILPSK